MSPGHNGSNGCRAENGDVTLVSVDVVTRPANVTLKMLTLRLYMRNQATKYIFQLLKQYLPVTLISCFCFRNPSLYSVKPWNSSGMKSLFFALVPLSTDILSSFLWFPCFSFPASMHLLPSNRVNSVFLCMRYLGFCEFHHHWDFFCFDFAFCHFLCCWLFCCSFHVMTKCSYQYRKSNLFSLSSLKMIKYQISLWQSFTGTIDIRVYHWGSYAESDLRCNLKKYHHKISLTHAP